MIKVINHDIFKATITIGLQKNYTSEKIKKSEVFKELKNLQKALIKTENIYLSANCFSSTIVLSGQQEPHLNLQFINYPKFPLKQEIFKRSVENIAEDLMYKFDQNRLVIQFHDSNVMLEKTNEIDHRIME